MAYIDTVDPNYMALAAPHCHVQVPVLSAIGKGPKGDKGDKGNPGLDSRYDFENVSLMTQESDLEPGDICHTLGFHEAGDGGAAYYLVTNEAEPNGMDIIQLNNGLFAELQITEPYVTPEMFGAYGDGEHDDSDIFQCLFDSLKNTNKIILLEKSYLINNPVLLRDTAHYIVKGSGCSRRYYNVSPHIKIGDNDLFVGEKLSNNQLTQIYIHMENVYVHGAKVTVSTGTVFKGLTLWNSVILECKFTWLWGVLEGGASRGTTFENCAGGNIRSFFFSDYVFKEPYNLSALRNNTAIDIKNYVYPVVGNINNCPKFVSGGLLSGWHPSGGVSGKDQGSFLLSKSTYFDCNVIGAYIDYWHAVQEIPYAQGLSISAGSIMNFDKCAFDEIVYFHDFVQQSLNGVTFRSTNFKLTNSTLLNFGEHSSVTDASSYTGSNYTRVYDDGNGNYYGMSENANSIVENNITSHSDKSFVVHQNNGKVHSSFNNFVPFVIVSSKTEGAGLMLASYIEELNYQYYEVDPTHTIESASDLDENGVPFRLVRGRTSVYEKYGLLFQGRKIIYKVNDVCYIRTVINPSESISSVTYFYLI